MRNMLKWMSTFSAEDKGASAVEYALLAALIAVVIAGAVRLVGVATNANFASLNF